MKRGEKTQAQGSNGFRAGRPTVCCSSMHISSWKWQRSRRLRENLRSFSSFGGILTALKNVRQEACARRSFETLWIVVHQAPLSMGFSRQEYWNRVAISSSRGSSRLRDWTRISWVSYITDRFFIHWAIREVPIDNYSKVLMSGVGDREEPSEARLIQVLSVPHCLWRAYKHSFTLTLFIFLWITLWKWKC